MLFSGCNCIPDASSLGVLCSGGAGFVSAMMAALAGAARTAEAQPLGRNVPTVDRLAVRIVTDNVVIQFVPNEKRGDLTIERKSGNTRPDAPPYAALNAEWGLAMHAESQMGGETRNVLVDFGYTAETLNNNMSILKIDPSAFDAMVLSHGHYDHFGGMVGFLEATKGKLKGKLPFYVGGEDAFCLRQNAGGNFGALDRRAIMDADLALMLSEGPALVADHAFTTGRIGQTSFEKPLLPTREIVGIFDGFGCYPEKMPAAKNIGQYIPDDFDHEIATVYNVKGKGLVVLTSCSHRGVINAIYQAQKVSGIDKVHAVIGGFHIVPPLGDDYIRDTIKAFQDIDPDHLIPAHCTGDRFYDLARQAMGEKVVHSAVGTRFIFEA
ncbi:MBL fold metallo-hydrolase [Rhodoplanes sp. Z2-YC6860]|uniref:MBL fold metallo-hydrolase n=1 Tax=Rhodoplanes sp. Z2-YC6860 TaxID=674703 RepID=UPI00078CC5A4|nr:MBL fold metallo-hydrolase [Rhodoplanes sp. Z2-YC6860]AMN44601.1 beta-lactamase domain-containing protein [Rhodoplanes sp. Z2-YC6860]